MPNRRPLTRQIIEYAFCDLDPYVDGKRKLDLKEKLNSQRSIISARKLRRAVKNAFHSDIERVRLYLGARVWPHKQIAMILLLTLDGLHQEASKYIEDAKENYSSVEIAKILSRSGSADKASQLQTSTVSQSLYDAIHKNKKSTKALIEFNDGTILRLRSSKLPGVRTRERSMARQKKEEVEINRVTDIVFAVPKNFLDMKGILRRDEVSDIQSLIDEWEPRIVEVPGGMDKTARIYIFRASGISVFEFNISPGSLIVVAADSPLLKTGIQA